MQLLILSLAVGLCAAAGPGYHKDQNGNPMPELLVPMSMLKPQPMPKPMPTMPKMAMPMNGMKDMMPAMMMMKMMAPMMRMMQMQGGAMKMYPMVMNGGDMVYAYIPAV